MLLRDVMARVLTCRLAVATAMVVLQGISAYSQHAVTLYNAREVVNIEEMQPALGRLSSSLSFRRR
jgi:hypothetical protein